MVWKCCWNIPYATHWIKLICKRTLFKTVQIVDNCILVRCFGPHTKQICVFAWCPFNKALHWLVWLSLCKTWKRTCAKDFLSHLWLPNWSLLILIICSNCHPVGNKQYAHMNPKAIYDSFIVAPSLIICTMTKILIWRSGENSFHGLMFVASNGVS